MPPASRSLGLTPAERAPLSVTVSRQLRDAIVAGRIPVGDEMPTEKDLARQLGVGRSTVREALRILQAQGLLSGGDTVSTARPRVSVEQTLASAASALENVLRLGQVPLDHLVELRVVLESAAVEWAVAQPARRRQPALAEAAAAVEEMAEDGIDIERFRAADLRFHRALAAAAGNAAVPLIMGVLRDAIAGHLGEALERVPDAPAAMAVLAAEHGLILAAVERGHGNRARELMTCHIRDFYGVHRDGPVR
jgi:DNA-binding FadR family transcriptional regulator